MANDIYNQYVVATRGHPSSQQSTYEKLKFSNPEVADLVTVYKKIEQAAGEPIVGSSKPNLVNAYNVLESLAMKNPEQAVGKSNDPKDVARAANILQDDQKATVADVQNALDGTLRTREYLIRLSGLVMTNEPDKVASMIHEQSTIDKEFSARLSVLNALPKGDDKNREFINIVKDISAGKLDQYPHEKAKFDEKSSAVQHNELGRGLAELTPNQQAILARSNYIYADSISAYLQQQPEPAYEMSLG